MPIFFARNHSQRLMICQFNVAQMKDSKDAPDTQSFFVAAPHIQRLAESSAGFVWRERNENDPIIGERLGPDFILNLSALGELRCPLGICSQPTVSINHDGTLLLVHTRQQSVISCLFCYHRTLSSGGSNHWSSRNTLTNRPNPKCLWLQLGVRKCFNNQVVGALSNRNLCAELPAGKAIEIN